MTAKKVKHINFKHVILSLYNKNMILNWMKKLCFFPFPLKYLPESISYPERYLGTEEFQNKKYTLVKMLP